MFSIHEVYECTGSSSQSTKLLRIIDMIDLERVVVIDTSDGSDSRPVSIDYAAWVKQIDDGVLTKSIDPYSKLCWHPHGLPPGAAERYKKVVALTGKCSMNPALLRTPTTLSRAIKEASDDLGIHARTAKRWILEWLRSGRNPTAVVKKFIRDPESPERCQTTGSKRGRKPRDPDLSTNVPAQELADKITLAWDLYVVGRRRTWRDAYNDMLIEIFKVPTELVDDIENQLFVNPCLLDKHKIPTWTQTRYRFRQFKKRTKEADISLPRGHRGKATDNVFGPGFFEIDATFFQIQLVSRLTKHKLVGRPVVYLIVDIFSDVITGYAISLENPSWAIAALALNNCFSDKESTFRRLNLPYKSLDWPCKELPNLLRADRAELISNMGQLFPTSGIRVEITPAMTPEAKGTVEGKHSEIKKLQPGRFDLPGRFEKLRKRRSPDGKRSAALDIYEFERILVEVILDINRGAVDPKKIPVDAVIEGAKVASRIGLYQWGLIHRAGFTREMGADFRYEHLMTKGIGTLAPDGIRFSNEVFNCDALLESGLLAQSLGSHLKMQIACNPLTASEIYFFNKKSSQWTPAYNSDPEIYSLKASFSEAKQFRALQEALVAQASLHAHIKRRGREEFIRAAIQEAVHKKRIVGAIGSHSSPKNIRQNRAQEKADQRLVDSMGTSPNPQTLRNPRPAPPEQAKQTSSTTSSPDFDKLWEQVNETSER